MAATAGAETADIDTNEQQDNDALVTGDAVTHSVLAVEQQPEPTSGPTKSHRTLYIFLAICLVFVLLTVIALSLAFFVFDVLDTDASTGSESVVRTDRPNIILILMDDVGYTDVGYLSNHMNGNSYSFETPTIDRLADSGIILNQQFCLLHNISFGVRELMIKSR